MKCKSIDTSICKTMKLTYNQGPTAEAKEMLSIKPHAHIMGNIMYAMMYRRSDVTLVVCLVSRFLSNLELDDWHASERILWYIKGTLKIHLRHQGDNQELWLFGCQLCR